jgi:DNA-binding NtrC family response regulator
METTASMSDKILIVDDEPSNRNILKQELTQKGYAVETANDGSEALRKADSSRPDLIILDYMMPDLSGLEVLKELRTREDDTPVIMITAYGTVDRAVESMKEGAYDFITRPFEPDHLVLVVEKALERQRLKRGVEVLAAEIDERHRLILGETPNIKHIAEIAKKVASSRATVLLLGESGTGKEIFARNIHSWSDRRNKPFIVVNCVGLSKELLESELFGHEQGAFNLADALEKGLFREDLYHRLNVVPLNLPPLRERKQEIPLLAQYFLRKYSKQAGKNFTDIAPAAMKGLVSYSWPGNVGELANVIEGAVVLGSASVLAREDLPTRLVMKDGTLSQETFSYRDGINAARKELIMKALEKTQGNRSAAAKVLRLEAK